MKNICIGIPTYNRKLKLETLAKTIETVDGIENASVCIFDDNSTEYDKSYLKELFQTAEIYRNNQNLGADLNNFSICKFFLEKRKENLLFLCDSDLVLHKKIIIKINEYFKKTDGLLTLLNASTHPIKDNIGNDLILKHTIGMAGMVISRELLSKIMTNFEDRYALMWDWYICMWMREHKKRILVTKNSYVFHTGIDGENSNVLLFDYAMNYFPSNDLDGAVVNNVNSIFVNKYLSLSAKNKVSILCRKLFRDTLRTMYAKVFGYRSLLKFLVLKKKAFKR